MSLTEQSYITKIEGHGSLEIKFDQCRAKLKINEGERLFESLVFNRPFSDGPFITSRICGVCPVAHTIASINALENALNISVPTEIEKLRKIMLASQIIQSHSLHLFFLALPDYLGISSAFELSKNKPELFNTALNLKKIGDKINTIIGGRNIHPITLIIGGFSKLPNKSNLKKIIELCKNNIESAKNTISLFASFKYPQINCNTQYMCLTNGNNYETYSGQIESSNNYIFDTKNYKNEIVESIQNNSPSKYAKHNNKSIMVGAISRISMHQDYLNNQAKKSLLKTKINFPTNNTFYNNLAQAIEILHFLEEIIKLCNELLQSDYENLKPINFELKACSGVGVIEAPRGLLYHYYELDRNGIIKNCDIITPTNQNLSNIELEMNELLKFHKNSKISKDSSAKELEKLIRAYDPCITCSVH